MRSLTALLALTIVAAPLTLPAAAAAQAAATAADTAAAGQFIDGLAANAFAVLRDKSLSKPAALTRFRGMLRDNFALTDIGNRLIKSHRNEITPAQLAAYQAALPDFVTNVYAARLFDYSDAEVKVTRAQPRGTRGDVDVFTRISRPAADKPVEAIWAVRRDAAGKLQVTNLSVAGINVALTQEADFSSYIQKNGFDGLVTFLRTANTRNGIKA